MFLSIKLFNAKIVNFVNDLIINVLDFLRKMQSRTIPN